MQDHRGTIRIEVERTTETVAAATTLESGSTVGTGRTVCAVGAISPGIAVFAGDRRIRVARVGIGLSRIVQRIGWISRIGRRTGCCRRRRRSTGVLAVAALGNTVLDDQVGQ
ncbi:MAG: hypothetical protein RBR19_12595, partial [Sedimentisphaerales bacterium]|nr:hypothetical protein [Sedimentisphaerales bacterium]